MQLMGYDILDLILLISIIILFIAFLIHFEDRREENKNR